MRFHRSAALAAAAFLGMSAAHAQQACPTKAGDCGYTVASGQVAQMTLGAASGFGARYQRITAPTTTRLWCTGVINGVPAVNGFGSYPIAAGSAEEYPIAGQAFVPLAPISCTPETGTASGSVRVN